MTFRLGYLVGKKTEDVPGQNEEVMTKVSARGKVKWTDSNWTTLYFIDSGILT